MTNFKSNLLSLNTFKLVLFLPFFFQYLNLVIGGDVDDDDSLENALDAIERRQRDLRMRENYGQPENIGYGFQKNLGLFEPGPSRFLGATREADDYGLPGLFNNGNPEKRARSSFRERNNVMEAPRGEEYLQAVRALWDKYQRQRQQRPVDLEDLTDQELVELLGALQDDDDDERNEVPVIGRSHRSYRVFDNYHKRSPSFGQGLGVYGKRQQHLARESPQNDAFLYSLKWVNPAMNRDGVETLRAADPYAEDRDGDIAAILGQARYPEAEAWLGAPATVDDDSYGNEERASRRSHRLHERKRAPVKRNANAAVVKPTASAEVKEIFGSSVKDKKPLNVSKKPTTLNTKISVDSPKKMKTEKKIVVRRAEPVQPGEIQELFKVQKKSVDWSKHFGVNKRMYADPFDTRVFNTKRNLADNLDVVENRIGGVEDKILEDAVKLTGAHGDEGIGSIREGVLRRLEAAYSLEKMRSALNEFKNSVNSGATESPILQDEKAEAATVTDGAVGVDSDKLKRVAIKKEGVDNDGGLDFFNWDRDSDAKDGPECPLLEVLVNNCVRMEEALGKFADLLTPACTLHQICYTCGPEFGFSRAAACDLMFLSEAEHLCQNKPECVGGARETVAALREVHERTPPLGTCRANPCVADHFLTSPSGIVTLDV